MDALERFHGMTNEMGLVPMVMITSFYPPYNEGSIAGFPPDRALEMFEAKEAVPCDKDGRQIDPGLPSAPLGPVAVSLNTTPIPDNWEGIHHLQKLRLAKEIRGLDQSSVMTKDEAEVIIAAEVERRKEQNR